MKTTTTLLAALLLAGVSQAALAQEHDHDHGDRPQFQDHGGGRGGGEHHGAGAPAPQVVPQAAPQAGPIAPQGGHARFGAPPPPGAAPAAVPAPPATPRQRDGGGDRHWDGDRRGGGGGDHNNNFAPGGTAGGDRHWDRRDVPREVTPPAPGERGWDHQHDGHDGDARRLERDGRAGGWDRHDGDHRNGGYADWNRDHRDGDHRGPPANWRHWQRGQFPSVYAAQHRYRVGGYRPPYGYFVRSWSFGDFLPSGWFGPGYWIDDFYDYDLPYPPPGYHWVRVGADVLLVDDYSGRIVQVIRDMFW